MTAARLLYSNLAEIATITASPALVTTLPETNLVEHARSKTARSTSTASQQIKLSWATAQTANAVFLAMHNFTSAAQMRVQTYSDAAWTTLLTDNAAANCFAPTGLASSVVMADPEMRIFRNSFRYITAETTMKSMTITITDAANPDGYFDIANLFVGQPFEFATQFPFGGVPWVNDSLTKQGRAEDGSIVSDKGENFVQMMLSHDFVSDSTDWKELLAIANRAGRDRLLFFDLYPTDTTYSGLYHRFACKFGSIGAINRHLVGLVQQQLALESN